MRQYITNSIYEYLKNKQKEEFNYLFIYESNWILVYGTEDIRPKLILIVSQLKGDLGVEKSDFENVALKVLSGFNLPIRILRFRMEEFSRNVVISNEGNSTFELIDTSKLYSKLFLPYQLPADVKSAAKPVNDATSSTFHDWQRNFLSGKIKVSDLDLIQYKDDYTIKRIFELKRSLIALDEWRPYKNDYPNYILLRRTIPPEIPFIVLYNLYVGNPRVEDLSKIRIFKVIDDKPTFQTMYRADKEMKNGQNFNFKLADIFK